MTTCFGHIIDWFALNFQIIIERGDGDEVEVRDADPSFAEVERAKIDPHLGLIHVSAAKVRAELKVMDKEGASGPSRRMEAVKRIVKRSLRKQTKSVDALPGPGQGPKSAAVPNDEQVFVVAGEGLGPHLGVTPLHESDEPQGASSTAHSTSDPKPPTDLGKSCPPSSRHSTCAQIEAANDDEQIWIEGHKVSHRQIRLTCHPDELLTLLLHPS